MCHMSSELFDVWGGCYNQGVGADEELEIHINFVKNALQTEILLKLLFKRAK